MLLDYENHRKMECEAILGNVIKLAEEHNLSTPYIEVMFALLNSINQSI
jgi:ketopantoate reductase